jgi:hypothetical protein
MNAVVQDLWGDFADSTVFDRPPASARGYRSAVPSPYFLTTARQASWLPEAKRLLIELSELPPNWDSYGGKPLSPAMRAEASALLEQIAEPGLPMPAIVPTTDGSIQFEWHERDIDLELRIRSQSLAELFFEDGRGVVPPIEEDLRYDLTPFRRALEVLLAR